MSRSPANKFSKDFTQGKILPAMLAFAFPLFLSNLLQMLYNVVDMIVVGQVVGEAGLSGLSIGGDVQSLLCFIAMGFSGAAQVVISQYLGAGLKEKMSRFIGTMSTFLILCSVVMTLVCVFFRGEILSLLNTPVESWDHALAYSTVCSFGLIFIYGYNVVSAIMRGLGDSKRPFVFIAISAVTNLLLDILFVAIFRWGAGGAALATILAQGVSFITALIYLYKNRARLDFELHVKDFLRLDKRELSVLIKLGVPQALRSASVLISKLFVNSHINSYGVTISAVTGIALKVDHIGTTMGNSFTTAGNAMVGQNIGAAKYDRVTQILRSSFLVNGISFALMIAVVVLFPRTVFGMFTSEASTLDVCMEYIPVSVIGFICSGLRGAMNAFTGGCGNYKFNFAVAIMDGIVARIGLSLLFGIVLDWGYYGFWMGNAVAGVTPFVLGAIFYATGWWKRPSKIVSGAK